MRKVMVAVLAVVGAMAGCAQTPKGGLAAAPAAGEVEALTKHAAAAKYPAGPAASDGWEGAAVVDRAKRIVTVRNVGGHELKDVNVWVNGGYVRKVDSVPGGGGFVVIHFGQFYDAQGRSLATQVGAVSRVQLE